MGYNVDTVQNDLETLYRIGFEKVAISEFVKWFCNSERRKKMKLNPNEEKKTIKTYLGVLAHKKKIRIEEKEWIIMDYNIVGGI